jgi:2-methylcitrate dehydratase
MVYIVATLVRKAVESYQEPAARSQEPADHWRRLMLVPGDYSDGAIGHPLTREIMRRIEFRHGGPEYDAKYPDGIPTTIEVEHRELGQLSSGLVMYPEGHARSRTASLAALLDHKFRLLAGLGIADTTGLKKRLTNLAEKTPGEIAELYSIEIANVRPA